MSDRQKETVTTPALDVDSTNIDAEWLYSQLQIDAAYVTALVMRGKGVEADAHLEACNYRERLEQWRALTGKPALR